MFKISMNIFLTRHILLLLMTCVCALTAPARQPEHKIVSAEWLAENLKNGSILVLHVGGREEFDQEHIPGSRYISLASIMTDVPDGLSHEMPSVADLTSHFSTLGLTDSSTIVIAFNNRRALPSAARVYVTLDYLGLGDRTFILDGGVDEWRNQGFELTAETATVAAGGFTPHPRQDLIVDKAWISDRLNDPSVVIIDARPPEYYTGRSWTEPAHRSGHIAGAYNIPFSTVVSDSAPFVFQSTEKLKALFEECGVDENSTIVTYCGTGIWASPVYFAARSLGYSVRFYDGSFEEWSADDTLPVVEPLRKSQFRSLERK